MSLPVALKTNALVPESPTRLPDGPLAPAPWILNVLVVPGHRRMRVKPVPVKLIVLPLRPSAALNWTDVSLMVKTSVLPEPDSPLIVTVPPVPANASVPPPRNRYPTGLPLRADAQAGVAAVGGHDDTGCRRREEDEVIGSDDVRVAQPGAEVDVADRPLEPVPPGLPALVGPGAAAPPVERGVELPDGLVVLHADGVAREAVVGGGQRRRCRSRPSRPGCRSSPRDRAVGDRGGAAVLDRDAGAKAGDGDGAGRERPAVDVDGGRGAGAVDGQAGDRDS